jgi:hypothetical protein
MLNSHSLGTFPPPPVPDQIAPTFSADAQIRAICVFPPLSRRAQSADLRAVVALPDGHCPSADEKENRRGRHAGARPSAQSESTHSNGKSTDLAFPLISSVTLCLKARVENDICQSPPYNHLFGTRKQGATEHRWQLCNACASRANRGTYQRSHSWKKPLRLIKAIVNIHHHLHRRRPQTVVNPRARCLCLPLGPLRHLDPSCITHPNPLRQPLTTIFGSLVHDDQSLDESGQKGLRDPTDENSQNNS